MEHIKIRISEILNTLNILEDNHIKAIDNFDISSIQNIESELLAYYRILALHTKHLIDDIED